MAAEGAGFDSFVYEDALLYRGDEYTDGVWESMAISAALGAATERINFGQSVINAPYRSPGLVASMASTLDEISNGRYILGIGAGNTSDSDYLAFGFSTDHRFGRFAEAIEIIHSLLKTGQAHFHGEYYQVSDSELVLRGPRPLGPPINIAGSGPKMLELVARYGDAWNWWVMSEKFEQAREKLQPLIESLESNLTTAGRSVNEVAKTIDFYSVVPPGFESEVPHIEGALSGSVEEIGEELLNYAELGVSEIRCDLRPQSIGAIEAMEPVVNLLHSGG